MKSEGGQNCTPKHNLVRTAAQQFEQESRAFRNAAGTIAFRCRRLQTWRLVLAIIGDFSLWTTRLVAEAQRTALLAKRFPKHLFRGSSKLSEQHR